MNRISKETTWAMSLMELIVLIEVFIGKLPVWSLIIVPAFYGMLWMYLKIFIWDKYKEFDIIIASPVFRKNDLVTVGNNKIALVIKVHNEGSQVRLNVFPIKETKSKILNIGNLYFIKMSCWLRSIVR